GRGGGGGGGGPLRRGPPADAVDGAARGLTGRPVAAPEDLLDGGQDVGALRGAEGLGGRGPDVGARVLEREARDARDGVRVAGREQGTGGGAANRRIAPAQRPGPAPPRH